jgi:hypothetical protein
MLARTGAFSSGTRLGARLRADTGLLTLGTLRRTILLTSQVPIDRWHDIVGNPTLADASRSGSVSVTTDALFAVKVQRPSLCPAIFRLSVQDRWDSGASLCSPFSNFRFGVTETGSICDRNWFAEPHCGRRARRWRKVRGLGRLSLQEPNALLLLGPRIRQGLGEAGDREIRWGGTIDDRRDDAG